MTSLRRTSSSEVKSRRAAEDRLSEVQRLLRISSEEEVRLREVIDEKDQQMKAFESTHSRPPPYKSIT